MRPLPRFARYRSSQPWRRLRPAAVTPVTLGIAVVVGLVGWHASRPGPASQDGGKPAAAEIRAGTGDPVTTARSAFSGIVLPDLLIVQPSGLTRGELTRLRAINGVRKMLSFDGAQITVGGAAASVIGVSPAQFRSWVPVRTASDQRLWARLTAGEFVGTTSSAARLRLSAGASYRLTGVTPATVRFGGAAPLGISGVDLVVNQAVSRKLGLIHQVAALISAPGLAISRLQAKVRRVLGDGARLVDLRDRQPASTPAPSHIANYLQLFQAASAKYCPALSWTVLAAIGQIESGDGANVGPSSAGALGPMQFLPSTWAEWGIDGFGPSGPPDIMNPFDAVPSAARMLCADGASSGTAAGLRQAIFAYNHADWYVNEVLALAGQYAAESR